MSWPSSVSWLASSVDTEVMRSSSAASLSCSVWVEPRLLVDRLRSAASSACSFVTSAESTGFQRRNSPMRSVTAYRPGSPDPGRHRYRPDPCGAPCSQYVPGSSRRTMRALRPLPRSSSDATTVRGVVGAVQGEHGVDGAGRRHDVGRRVGHDEAERVDLAGGGDRRLGRARPRRSARPAASVAGYCGRMNSMSRGDSSVFHPTEYRADRQLLGDRVLHDRRRVERGEVRRVLVVDARRCCRRRRRSSSPAGRSRRRPSACPTGSSAASGSGARGSCRGRGRTRGARPAGTPTARCRARASRSSSSPRRARR